MHLGGRAEFSTFRRTLAALLGGSLQLTSEDDPHLSEWINDHLQVTPVVVENADALGRLEECVLQRLDPPLGL
jgi:GIY-YIG catalytic domain